jgi:ABC-type glycerol-3-phosphate transport system substrate-binding protein
MREALAAAMENFNESESGVSIDLLEQGQNCVDLPAELQADVATGNVADLANLCLSGLRQFIEAGVAQPIDDLVASDPSFDVGQYSEAALEPFRYEGKLYGLPNAASVTIVYYNVGLLNDAGLDPDALPETWSDFREAARRLDDPDANVEGLAFILGADNYPFSGLLYSNSGSFMNEDETEFAFNDEAGIETLDLLRELARGELMPVLTDTDLTQDLFTRGQAAMFARSSSNLGQIEDQAEFEVRVAPMPRSEYGETTGVLQGLGFLMFSEDPKEQEAAWEAMKALTSPEAVTEVVRTTGFLSPNKAANEDPQLLADSLAESPNRAIMTDLIASSGTPVYEFPGSRGSEIHQILFDQIVLALRGEKTSEQALNDAAEQARPLLPQ